MINANRIAVDLDLLPPLPKRTKTSETVTTLVSIQEPPLEPQTTWYHVRMAVHCSLQNMKSHIGSISERVCIRKPAVWLVVLKMI